MQQRKAFFSIHGASRPRNIWLPDVSFRAYGGVTRMAFRKTCKILRQVQMLALADNFHTALQWAAAAMLAATLKPQLRSSPLRWCVSPGRLRFPAGRSGNSCPSARLLSNRWHGIYADTEATRSQPLPPQIHKSRLHTFLPRLRQRTTPRRPTFPPVPLMTLPLMTLLSDFVALVLLFLSISLSCQFGPQAQTIPWYPPKQPHCRQNMDSAI